MVGGTSGHYLNENDLFQVYIKLENDDPFTPLFNKEVRSSVNLVVRRSSIDKIVDIQKFSIKICHG